jgi:methylenetetrahydrofolate dehydrogenase (NADP+)/methenyltetrahydrofolate cyclohydrolase
MLLSGQQVAQKIINATKLLIEEAKAVPGIGVILVGDDAPSHLYVGIKERKARELGMLFEKKVLAEDTTEEEIIEAIKGMNKRQDIHGIIVQLPLPEHLDTDAIIAAIDPSKDTDGFHPVTIEKFLAGDMDRLPVFPRAMLELVKYARPKTGQEKAIAAVNSELMGKVLVKGLENQGYEAQYVLGTEEVIIEKFRTVDVVLTALGAPRFFSATEARPGAILIDGGITYSKEGEVIGDITRDDGVYRTDIFVTPVPGGVGPVTVAVLLARVTEAALRIQTKVL